MKKGSNWRTKIILGLFFIFGAAIISRLFFLQIIERKLFQAQALGQHVGVSDVKGQRGQIFCSSSRQTKGAESGAEVKSLAINKDSWTLYASINEIENKETFAGELSKHVDLTKEQILAKLNGESVYVPITKEVTTEQLNKIKALNLKGLSPQNEPERFYPQGSFLAQELGFLGGEGYGQYGLEGYYDDLLRGKVGIKEERRGLDSIFANNDQQSLDGSNLYLTIDYNIQFEAESLLKKAREKLDIASGQIIVLKPDSGRILALANYPSFDPNQYSKENLGIFQNGAVQKLFEPGSIMKPITMAAALNEGKITPDTTYVDTGVVTFGTKSIHNFNNEKYGKQTMTQVLESSINTGAVYAEEQISHKTFWDYIEKFGLIEKTGVDLQGEVASLNELLRKGSDVNFATASFGQGIELTPMQIARAFCAIANGGKLVKPYIVDKIENNGNEVVIKREVSQPLVSSQTISKLTGMMVSVVDNGFNSVAKIPGYYLAGKTGTAQIPLENGRGYEPDDKTIQSFVGFGPAFNPQFLILVKLDKPKVPKSSLSAVPIFKELAQYIINYWQIPPDYDATKK
jgi:cell division protein FtsI (penicillin-binding protein 3)/stage V sporulation protein D (sporulation-specific penicillin-binding protein)